MLMDKQSYLDSISKNQKTSRKSSSLGNLLSSKAFKFGSIFVGLFIIIAIVGSILSGLNSNPKALLELNVKIDNLSATINTYRPSLKSSFLRGSATSLQTIFTETNKNISTALTASKDERKKAVEQAAAKKKELDDELFSAKINGFLDRIFARKMAYEISILISDEQKIYSSTKNQNLKNALAQSIESLNNLYDSFDSFSESK